MSDTKGPYSLYKTVGKIGDTQSLFPIITDDDGSKILPAIFEAIENKDEPFTSLTVMYSPENKYAISFIIKDLEHERQYYTRLFAELTGTLKFSWR